MESIETYSIKAWNREYTVLSSPDCPKGAILMATFPVGDDEERTVLEAFANMDSPGEKYSFSIFPPIEYTGTPTEWRAETNTIIEWHAMNHAESNPSNGRRYVLAGHPDDIIILRSLDKTLFPGLSAADIVPVMTLSIDRDFPV
jgi:hypothetical protein